MYWPAALEAVRVAIATALQLPDYTGADGNPVGLVEWSFKQSAARWAASATADLRLGAITTKGTDETRYEYLDAPLVADQRLVPTYGGYRMFTVSVLIEVDSQAYGEESVATLAGRLRTRLRRRDVLQILHDANVAIAGAPLATTAADYVSEEGRVISAAVMDLVFSTTETDTDTDSGGDFIATAEGTGELTDPGGAERDTSFDTAG